MIHQFLAVAVPLWAMWVAWWQLRVAKIRAARAAMVARCDAQHALVMAGDDRGVFGAYPPAVKMRKRPA